jgi:hypothetical protein
MTWVPLYFRNGVLIGISISRFQASDYPHPAVLGCNWLLRGKLGGNLESHGNDAPN